MLKKRECLLNVNAIFHCIIGARTFAVERAEYKPVQEAAKKNLKMTNEQEHMKILMKLLALGVDVNVHDYAGFTPLHHCLTEYGNKVTFKMAERLIRAGADVNAKTRFGTTPLAELVRTSHYEPMAL